MIEFNTQTCHVKTSCYT